jgi:hypothetical protein
MTWAWSALENVPRSCYYSSNANTRFQSFFMLITVQSYCLAFSLDA